MKDIKLELVRVVQENHIKKSNKKKRRWGNKIFAGALFIATLSLSLAQAEHTKSIIYAQPEQRVVELEEESVLEPTVCITVHSEELTGDTILTSSGISNYFDEMADTIDLIARTAIAEVGYDCEYCQIMVIDTILNRIDDERFANTAQGVIMDSIAFETVKNNAIWQVNPTQQVKDLIWNELISRTDSNVLAFREYEFHTFGYPITSCHNAYYSGM